MSAKQLEFFERHLSLWGLVCMGAELLLGRQFPAAIQAIILCTGNSCRSHLAEGILRAAAGDLLETRRVFEAYAAGLRAGRRLA